MLFNFYFTAVKDGIYLLKITNRNTRTRCQICSKYVFPVYFTPCSSVSSIVNFEHAIADWGTTKFCMFKCQACCNIKSKLSVNWSLS